MAIPREVSEDLGGMIGKLLIIGGGMLGKL
jgi:hypothetical protein